jgi:hypothetical protein
VVSARAPSEASVPGRRFRARSKTSSNSNKTCAVGRHKGLLEAGETQSDIARSYNVDATTIGRLA